MTGKLDPDYEREVDQMTARLERDYANAEKRVEASERRAARIERVKESAQTARDKKGYERDLAAAWEQVSARRDELARLASLMSASPASAAHRGTKSFRTVPAKHGPSF